MTREDMERLTAGAETISEKIRILYDSGVSKTDISAFVERRYQHVYNVIKDYEKRKAAGAPVAAVAPAVLRLTVDSDGTLRLPPEWLEAEGLKAGDVIICRTEARGLLLMSRDAAAEVLRDFARKHMPGEAALLDALLGPQAEVQ